MRHQNVRNADEVETREMIKGRHNMRLRQLGKPAGSRALGATLTEVAPGAVSFPRHAHHANEEAIYVLSGSGEARIGEERVAVRPGDWIALPAGPSHAHQMVNSSATDPLVYLCVSTMDTDIISAQHFWTGGLETAGPGCYDAVAIARTAGFRMLVMSRIRHAAPLTARSRP